MSFPRYERYKDSGVEWLGYVPEHWQIERLKTTIQRCKNGVWGNDQAGDEWDIPCVRVADFDRDKLRVKDVVPTLRNVVDNDRSGRILRMGDLLLEKSGGGDLQPVGCVVLYDHDQEAVCSNFVARMQLASGMDASYCRYLHASIYGLRLTVRSINQTSGIQNLDQYRYLSESIALPSHEEQVAIAAFLERETAKIDALIEEQQRLMALLQEKRKAVISNAVTKGLNPDTPKIPSHVEEIGDIPSHWKILRVRHVSTFTTSGPRGWSERVSESGRLFVQSGDLGEALQIDFEHCKRVNVEDGAEASRTLLANGDNVVCITGAKTGNVAICEGLEEPAFVNQHLCLIRPNDSILPRFLGLLLKSRIGQTHFEKSQYGMKQGLSLEDVREAPVLLPPIQEQRQILCLLDSDATKFNNLYGSSETAIRLLQERRSALISAAVTGKIDGRDYTPKEAA